MDIYIFRDRIPSAVRMAAYGFLLVMLFLMFGTKSYAYHFTSTLTI